MIYIYIYIYIYMYIYNNLILIKSYYSNYNNIYTCDKFIKREDLLIKNNYTKKSLLENNKVIVGAFINTYKFKKGT